MAGYKLGKAADNDLARLYLFGFQKFGEKSGDEYYDGIITRLERISQTPKLYPAITVAEKSYRRSVYGSHSIYYSLRDDDVFIVRVLGRENPAKAR